MTSNINHFVPHVCNYLLTFIRFLCTKITNILFLFYHKNCGFFFYDLFGIKFLLHPLKPDIWSWFLWGNKQFHNSLCWLLLLHAITNCKSCTCKVQIFWEGHKNLAHLPLTIWRYYLTANIFESGPMPTPWKFLDSSPVIPSC